MKDKKEVEMDFKDIYGVLQLAAKPEDVKHSNDSDAGSDASQSSWLPFKIAEKIKAIFLLGRKKLKE